jgi:hypothetical protein
VLKIEGLVSSPFLLFDRPRSERSRRCVPSSTGTLSVNIRGYDRTDRYNGPPGGAEHDLATIDTLMNEMERES